MIAALGRIGVIMRTRAYLATGNDQRDARIDPRNDYQWRFDSRCIALTLLRAHFRRLWGRRFRLPLIFHTLARERFLRTPITAHSY
jgi:hypothetical protein